MKYIIYLRVSTDQQVQSGLGLEAQRQLCHKFINNPLAHVIEYSDEGFSGALKMEKRPGLLEALNILDKDDILLVAKRDRLGRDPIVNAMIERAVERKKARLISGSGDVNDGTDASSTLMRRMVDAFAEYERLIIGARTKAALQVKKQRNERVGYIPYGFRLCEDNIHLQPDEKEQKILQVINYSRSISLSFRKIAAVLNSMEMWNRAGKNWNYGAVRRVLK